MSFDVLDYAVGNVVIDVLLNVLLETVAAVKVAILSECYTKTEHIWTYPSSYVALFKPGQFIDILRNEEAIPLEQLSEFLFRA